MTDFAIALVTDQQPPQGQPTFLAAGGSVAYVSDLSFRVSAGLAYFNYVAKSFAATNVTLDAADDDNDRFDAIIVDSTGTVSVVTGTPAPTPSTPDLDPVTQLLLALVRVDATVTDLAISTTDVYKENAEWTSSVSGGTVSAASTTTPYAGTKCIRFAAAASGAYVRLTNGAAVSLANLRQLVFQIAPEGSWPNPKSVLVTWYSGTTKVGQSASLANGAYSLVVSSTAWQQIVIPVGAFQIPAGTAVDRLEFKVNGGGGNLTFRLDDIRLESESIVISIGTPVTDAQVEAAIWAALVKPWVTLTDAATIEWNVANIAEAKAQVTITDDRVLSIVGAVNGQRGVLMCIQDGTGGHGLTLPAGSVQVGGGGTEADLTADADAVDILAWERTATGFLWTVGKGAA